MSITIDLPPKTEEQLLEKAASQGAPAEYVAARVLIEALEWEAQDRAEAIEGVKRGLEDSEAGRVKPAEEVFAKMRAAVTAAQK